MRPDHLGKPDGRLMGNYIRKGLQVWAPSAILSCFLACPCAAGGWLRSCGNNAIFQYGENRFPLKEGWWGGIMASNSSNSPYPILPTNIRADIESSMKRASPRKGLSRFSGIPTGLCRQFRLLHLLRRPWRQLKLTGFQVAALELSCFKGFTCNKLDESLFVMERA